MLLPDCSYVSTHLANGVNNVLPMDLSMAAPGYVQGRSGSCCALLSVDVLIKHGLRIEPLCATRTSDRGEAHRQFLGETTQGGSIKPHLYSVLPKAGSCRGLE
jgi:hypothetical protein